MLFLSNPDNQLVKLSLEVSHNFRIYKCICILSWVCLSVVVVRGPGFDPHRRHCVVSLSKTH